MAKFDRRSTADGVLSGIDLTGKHILVTGVSSGLGLETARALVARGAHVIGAVRDPTKAAEATSGITDAARAAGGRFDLVHLDLASLASCRDCAAKLLAAGSSIDAVIANAGVMATPFALTVDGFETQFATNYLGHFLLINRISSLLAAGGRVVLVTSGAHRAADVDLEDPNFERVAYEPRIAYARSKTAEISFSVEFDRRHRHSGLRACTVVPGVIDTNIGRYLSAELRSGVEAMLAGPLAAKRKTVAQGAATLVWAAVIAEGELVGGRCVEDFGVLNINDGSLFEDGVRTYAVDPDRARKLWLKTEEWVSERFD